MPRVEGILGPGSIVGHGPGLGVVCHNARPLIPLCPYSLIPVWILAPFSRAARRRRRRRRAHLGNAKVAGPSVGKTRAVRFCPPHPQVGAKNYWPVAAAAAAAMTAAAAAAAVTAAAAAVAAVTVTAATGGPSETPLLPQRKLIFKGAPRRRRFDLKIGGGTPMTDRPSLASSQGLSPL